MVLFCLGAGRGKTSAWLSIDVRDSTTLPLILCYPPRPLLCCPLLSSPPVGLLSLPLSPSLSSTVLHVMMGDII